MCVLIESFQKLFYSMITIFRDRFFFIIRNESSNKRFENMFDVLFVNETKYQMKISSKIYKFKFEKFHNKEFNALIKISSSFQIVCS